MAVLKRRLEADAADAEAAFSLAALLRALTGCVSALRERRHEALLAELLGARLWLYPASVRAAALDAYVNLMVANAAFVTSCLQALLFSLLPPPGAPPAAAGLPPDEPGAPWQPGARALEVQGQVLGALERALALIPTLPAQLLPMLLQNLPHKTRDRAAQCLYVRAALALAEGARGAPLREGLLLGVVDHLLSLDVEIKWEDIVDVRTGQEQEEGSSEEDDDDDGEDIFELETAVQEGMHTLDVHGAGGAAAQLPGGAHPPGARGGWEGNDGGAAAAAAAQAAAEAHTVDEAVDKLDSLMELVLDHVARRCAAGQLAQVWATLMAAFERSLLHTHRSKFTQYLLFRACAEDPARCSEAFAGALLARVRDARQAPVARAAAAAYLASFLARCALAPEAVVVGALQQLAAACAEYAARVAGGGGGSGGSADGDGGAPTSGVVKLGRSGSGGALAAAAAANGDAAAAAAAIEAHPLGADAQRHQVFYAMVQALLYVLCYHMGPLVHQQKQHPGASPAHAAAVKALVRGAVAPLLAHARLQPLAVCLPSVSEEFVRQAAALRIADLSPLLEAARAANAAAGGGAAAAARPQPAAGDGAAAPAPAPLVRPAVRPLEMFFPFDPYLLRRSARLLSLDTTYVRWRGGHPHAAEAADGGDGGAAGAAAGGAAAAGAHEGDDDALGSGSSGDDSGSGSSSSDEDDDDGGLSSSDLEDEDDHHMAASLDPGSSFPGGLTPPGIAAAAAGAMGAAPGALPRVASFGLRPVGVAAAAAAAAAAQQQQRQRARMAAHAALSVSGPSPDALMLGASLVSSGGLPDSYGAGGASAGLAAAAAAAAAARHGHHHHVGSAASGGGGLTPLGASPAPMSFEAYGGANGYMHSVPARLNGQA